MKRTLGGVITLLFVATSALTNGGEDMRKAYLEGADLSGHRLEGADMTGAYLVDADLSAALLSRALLRRAFLDNANLREADLSGADLRQSFLDEADLRQANLENANLTGTFFDYANLSGANLSGANLSGVSLAHATLAGANLSRTVIDDSALRDADASDAWIWLDQVPHYSSTTGRWSLGELISGFTAVSSEYNWALEYAVDTETNSAHTEQPELPTEAQIRSYFMFIDSLVKCPSKLRADYVNSQMRGTPSGCDSDT